MGFVILLGLLFLGYFVSELFDGIKRRHTQNKVYKSQEQTYQQLIQQQREDEALRRFHYKKHNQYSAHPVFCRCIKCSTKRFFH